jgi:hypothetical protein
MEEEVARWIRIEAAKRGTSVSRLLGEIVKEKMEKEDSYFRSMRSYLDQPPYITGSWEPYPKREDLYDRQSLR